MADAVGLVSLGITVCKGLLDYYASVRNGTTDIHRTWEMVDSLASTLQIVSQTLKTPSLDPEIIHLVHAHITRCQVAIHTLEKRLEKLMLSSKDGSWTKTLANAKMRLSYPFKESTLAKTREICAELRDHLGLALLTLNLDTSASTQLRIEDLANTTSTTRSSLEKLKLGASEAFGTVRKLESIFRSEKDIELLEWLSPLKGTFENKQQEVFGTSIRQDAGAQSLLQSEAFKKWNDGVGESLWCTAPRKHPPLRS